MKLHKISALAAVSVLALAACSSGTASTAPSSGASAAASPAAGGSAGASFAAPASTVNLNVLTPRGQGVVDPLWTQTSSNWLRDMGVMIGLAVMPVAMIIVLFLENARRTGWQTAP